MHQASQGGRLYFTRNLLYLYYCMERMPMKLLWTLAGGVGGLVGYQVMGNRGAMMAAAGAAALVYQGTRAWRPPARSVLDDVHKQMTRAGHQLPRYISRPLFEFCEEEKYVDHLPKATDVDHVLIVDRNELVDWLVLNDLPRRLNAIVISHTGYPNYVVPIVSELLERRKSIGIYLLHDSSESSISIRKHLADSRMLPTDGHRIFNLGIDPEQVTFMKHLAPIQPNQSEYRIPLDSIPYDILERALSFSVQRGAPLLTGFAAAGWVGRKS